MTHTQPLGNQSESDASCLDSHISDKQDSKALLEVVTVRKLLLLRTIVEGQSWR